MILDILFVKDSSRGPAITRDTKWAIPTRRINENEMKNKEENYYNSDGAWADKMDASNW